MFLVLFSVNKNLKATKTTGHSRLGIFLRSVFALKINYSPLNSYKISALHPHFYAGVASKNL